LRTIVVGTALAALAFATDHPFIDTGGICADTGVVLLTVAVRVGLFCASLVEFVVVCRIGTAVVCGTLSVAAEFVLGSAIDPGIFIAAARNQPAISTNAVIVAYREMTHSVVLVCTFAVEIAPQTVGSVALESDVCAPWEQIHAVELYVERRLYCVSFRVEDVEFDWIGFNR
jgi:hypothetical protein